MASLTSANNTMYGCVLLPQLAEHMNTWSKRHALTRLIRRMGYNGGINESLIKALTLIRFQVTRLSNV